jgi:hypothetical protein
VAYLDRGKPNEAVADWRACAADPRVGGVAHYYLGNFLATQTEEYYPTALEHFDAAVQAGWAEGHIGKAWILLKRGFRLRDYDHQPEAAAERFWESIAEATAGLASPAVAAQRRAYSVRASGYYNLGDVAAAAQDNAACEALVVNQSDRGPDPRANAKA